MSTTSNTGAPPHQQPSQTVGNLLSCISCRQRKIRCDKTEPNCSRCLKFGTKCIYPTRRPRRTRRLASDVHDVNTELLRRIRRLEAILAKKDDTGSFRQTLLQSLPNSAEAVEGASKGITINTRSYASFVELQSQKSRHLNTEFWSGLSDEFNGLYQFIDDTGVEDEDDSDDSIDDSGETTESLQPSFILQSPDSYASAELQRPSAMDCAVLIGFYFANVDPAHKILHRGSIDGYLSNLEELVDPQTRRFKFRSMEAVSNSMYFAAVMSMSAEECLTNFGETRAALVARYKRNTEVALTQAGFLHSLEHGTLQAFTIYIIALRCLDGAWSCWTLIGLAVRIAQNIGLHRDGDGEEAFSAFEAQMRRRLWWQILSMDIRASEDRGQFESLIASNSSNTPMPCNLDDEDFNFESKHPLRDKRGPTDMTICLLRTEAEFIGHRINFTPALTLDERRQLVEDYVRRVNSTLLVNCDFANDHTRLLHLMSQNWIYKLKLSLSYPLGREILAQRTQGLETALAFLDNRDSIEKCPPSLNFAWLYQTHIPWHAIAIILAELSSQPQGPLPDRAWEIIERRFKNWNDQVSDVKQAMIWDLIKKLLKRARMSRRKAQELLELSEATKAPSNSDYDLLPPTYDTHETLDPSQPPLGDSIHSTSFDPQSFDGFDHLGQSMEQSLQFFSFSSESANLSDDFWNEFTHMLESSHDV